MEERIMSRAFGYFQLLIPETGDDEYMKSRKIYRVVALKCSVNSMN